MIYNPYVPIGTGGVAVPNDFAGVAMIGWPSTGRVEGPVNVPNNVTYKNTITDNWQSPIYTGLSLAGWNEIETSAGVYDYSNLDVLVDGCAEHGVSLTYQCLWMPTFYSANPTQPYVHGLFGTGGPLNEAGKGIGGGLYNFVYTTVLRYKNRGTPLKCWMTWVEPHWPNEPGAGTWWGTKGEMVDLAYWAYVAAKAADPDIIVLGPSTTDTAGYASTSVWVNETGTANTGVYGHQTFDEWAVDLFRVIPPGFVYPDIDQKDAKYRLKNPSDIVSWVNILSNGMAPNVKPIAFTNLGASDNVGNLNLANYLISAPAIVRKQWVARSMLTAAAMGVTRVCLWNYDQYVWTDEDIGHYFFDFVNDTNGVVAGFNEVANNVVGKTITFCGYRGDGQMVASFSDGSQYVV